MNRNQSVTKLLSENQYKYPALPAVVPNAVRNMVIVPTPANIVTDPISSRFTVQYPMYSKVRYLMVYAAKFNSNIDIKDASQIVDKVAYRLNSDTVEVIIPAYQVDKNTKYAITFIDYYGNESEATEVNLAL